MRSFMYFTIYHPHSCIERDLKFRETQWMFDFNWPKSDKKKANQYIDKNPGLKVTYESLVLVFFI